MRIGSVSLSSSNLLIGAGVVLLAPLVIPAAAGVLRPLVKAAIKGAVITYIKVKETTAEAIEALEDLSAEARAELTEGEDAAPQAAKKTAKAKAA